MDCVFASALITSNIKKYFFKEQNKHDRLKSWEFCYNSFKDSRDKKLSDSDLDNLALNLGFYLASWGMMRGSSFLINYNYKIHIDIVKIILDSRYDELCGISAKNLMKEKNIDLVIELSNKITNTYNNLINNNDKTINHVTDTLVTKILLGTLGCVPAYDRFFKQTLKDYSIASQTFNKSSLKDLCQFYLDNEQAFYESHNLIQYQLNMDYPDMKLLDMCFWQESYDKI